MITDHDHVYVEVGGFRGPRCAECGERIHRHLSYGRELAAIIGGDPESYVEQAPREEG